MSENYCYECILLLYLENSSECSQTMKKPKHGFGIIMKEFGNSLQVLLITISQSSKESILHLSLILKQFKVKGFLSKSEENITQFYFKNQ